MQGYDVMFVYAGKTYHLLYDSDGASLCGERYTKEYIRFKSPVDLIENLEIEGRKLIDIVDDIEEIDAM